MKIERRRDYRFSVRLSARVRRAGRGDAEPFASARVADLSLSGANLRLDIPPDWKLSEISTARPGLELELDLGGGDGPLSCAGKLSRVEAVGAELELGIQFAWSGSGGPARVRRFLDRLLDSEGDGETRRLYALHVARRRRQGFIVAGLLALTGICLVIVFCSFTESLPRWIDDLKSALRQEARQAARGATEDEIRRLRADPGAVPETGRDGARGRGGEGETGGRSDTEPR